MPNNNENLIVRYIQTTQYLPFTALPSKVTGSNWILNNDQFLQRAQAK